MNDREYLINKIKENLDKIGINIDCSRFEESYGGYVDSREWFMDFDNGRISIDVYLSRISEIKLKLMLESVKL